VAVVFLLICLVFFFVFFFLVNVLSKDVMDEFRHLWEDFQKDSSLKGGVLISAKVRRRE
jgi:hypothetical protein